MRRFELIEGTSSKFWEVEVQDTELTVRFGRIGTAGQSKTKTFATGTAAAAEAAKLVKEKTGKGYREVSATGAATPASEPTPPHQPSARAAKPAVSDSPPPAGPEQAPPSALDWPGGGFEWDAESRRQLPIVRGIHAPPVELGADPLSHPPNFSSKATGSALWVQHSWGLLRQAAGLQGGAPWTKAEAAEQLVPERLRSDDPAYWRELILQCAARCNYNDRAPLVWAIDAAVAAHSIAFATGTLLELGGDPGWHLGGGWYGKGGPYGRLRAFLAAAPEDEHRAARQVAERYRGRTPELDCIVSYLFPEIQEWAEAAVAHGLSDPRSSWLDESLLSVESACRLYRGRTVYFTYALPAALLQIHRHGEAALPFLETLLDRASNREDTAKGLKLLLRMRTPAVIPMLLARIENKEVLAVLDRLAEQWPAALLKSAVELAAASRSRVLEGWTVRLALRRPECVEPALAACAATERERFEALLAELARPEEAPAEALPELLRSPPWTAEKRPEPLPMLAIEPLEQTACMAWPEGLREQWAASRSKPAWLATHLARQQQDDPSLTEITLCLRYLQIKAEAHGRVLAGETLSADDFAPRPHAAYCSLIGALPDSAALALWNSLPAEIWYDGNKGVLPALLAAQELKALPGLLAYASAHRGDVLELALPFRCGEFVPLAAHALKNLKKSRDAAMAWLRAHPETAIAALVPPAFGKDRALRDNAQYALRWLAQDGHEGEVRRIAASYREAAAEAVDRLLGDDPASNFPAKMPKLPAFFVPAALRRPVLKSGGALPAEAAGHLGLMLAIGTLTEPYAGLETVKAACTAGSLAEFAWDVFEAWTAAGAPSKESWAFTALGLLGDDETARRLAPKLREWPGESAHARAVAGLDLLAAIGGDVALMHLNGIAQKVKFKGLQDKAREKIAQVAEARGLSPEELADRLVPDLGLDEDGRLALDFGPRRFFVGFDEALKPYVTDEAGGRLKDLPRPLKSDDADKAGAAVECYKALKKDAKAIAGLQIVRLEQAMCTRRRWPAEDFRRFFLDHPLMRHLARRLVWGVYRDGGLAEAFRVAEDLTLADRNDDLYELPVGADIGLAHVLDLPEDLRRDFGQIFGDYEILQPFRQLGRETYALTDEERRTGRIERYKDRKIATGSIMGLVNRGWERGEALDGGWVGWFRKRLPGGLEAELQLDPGTVVGDLSFEPEQTIPALLVRRQGTYDNDGLVDLAGLDPVLVSELIRDADLLAPLAKA